MSAGAVVVWGAEVGGFLGFGWSAFVRPPPPLRATMLTALRLLFTVRRFSCLVRPHLLSGFAARLGFGSGLAAKPDLFCEFAARCGVVWGRRGASRSIIVVRYINVFGELVKQAPIF